MTSKYKQQKQKPVSGTTSNKNFYTAKETTDVMKKQPRESEELFSSHISDEGLTPTTQ